MPHYPGHQDDRTPRGGGMPVIPAQPNPVIPPVSGAAVWSATQPRNMATATMFDRLRSPQKDASGRTIYPAIPAGPLLPGARWEQVPGGYVYVPPTAANESTKNTVAGRGVNTDFSKIQNAALKQKQGLRTQYMMELSPLQESIRRARAGGAENLGLLRSQMAQRAIGGFGGISAANEERILNAARAQEAGLVQQKEAVYSDYLAGLLGVDKGTADAIAAEAVKRAAKLAGAEKAYLEREAQKLIASYEGLGGK